MKQVAGTTIERGVVQAKENQGYIVLSLDRVGIISPPMTAVDNKTEYNEGDTVYFFLFRDGTGKILCSAT